MTDPRKENPRADKGPVLSPQVSAGAIRRRFAVVSAVALAASGLVAHEAGWTPSLDSFRTHSAPVPDSDKTVPVFRHNPELPSQRVNVEAARIPAQTIEEVTAQGEADAQATDEIVKVLEIIPVPPEMPAELRTIHNIQRAFINEGKPSPPFAVSMGIMYASDYTGVDPEYLHRLAYAESTFRAGVTNTDGGGRGACGLYQFRASSTYLEAIYRHGDKFPEEYSHLANTVELYVAKKTRKGPEYAYRIKGGVDKDMVYDACYDPKFASVLAALHTLDLKNAIERRVDLDRPVNHAELYLSHFLGENGGPRLIEAYDEGKGNSRVTNYVSSRQRSANRGIFNRVRTVDDLYEFFVENKGMTDDPLALGPAQFPETESAIKLPEHPPLPRPRPT